VRVAAKSGGGSSVRAARRGIQGGDASEVAAVLWATGYRLDHSWIEIPGLKDERGIVVHERGVTSSAGLYMLGLSWQHQRTSALLGWVAQDAEFLVDRIESLDRTKDYLGRWWLEARRRGND
jgi:putative flavoprotein involved in K+ transport